MRRLDFDSLTPPYLSTRACVGLAAALTLVCTDSVDAETKLEGTYVYLQQTVTETKIPVLDDVVAKTRSVSIHRLKAEGERLSGPGELCSLRLESSSKMVQTTFPQAFIQAIPPVQVDLRLKGREVRSQPQTLVLGARLDDPRQETLPNHAQDARVFDQDGDGHPGMTVEVSGLVSGQVYVVQRSTTELHGKRAGDRLEGRLKFELDQAVVGASKSMLKQGPDPTPDPSRSFFRMQRVSDDITCVDADRLAHGWR